jgi:ribonuclease BN (tRNA processing enzyme)
MFDSGVGGLTVAQAVMEKLPNESIVYVGDNARFPYGPKPVEEIRRYALEIAGYLAGRGVKMIVVACNSVEVSAIDEIAAQAGIPVVGVIDPGTRAAVAATRNGVIGLIGTEATVASKAYDRAVAATGEKNVTLHSQACPLFVEFVERGETSGDELRAVAGEYLEPLSADFASDRPGHGPGCRSGFVGDRNRQGRSRARGNGGTDEAGHSRISVHRGSHTIPGNRGFVPRPGDRRCRGGATRGRRRRSPVRLTILGCDGSWPGPGGVNSGYLVEQDDTKIWMDAGAGTMAVIQQHTALSEIDAMFITHAHPDHFVDLYPLSIARHYGGLGTAGLPVLAPPGFFETAMKLLSAGTTEAWMESFSMKEIQPGDGERIGSVMVSAFSMTHSGISLGYRLEAPGGVLAYTGDAGPAEAVVELAIGADVFVSEATWQDGRELPFHMTARQAGEFATRAGARKLVLTHIEPILDKQISLAQAKEAFDGEIVLAESGLQLEVGSG